MVDVPGSSAPAPPPPLPPGRAGRDLPVAIAVGVTLAALVLVSLYVYQAAFVCLAALAVGLGVVELAYVLRNRRIEVPRVPVLVGAVAMLLSAYAAGESGLLVALALTLLAVLLWRIPYGPDGYVRDTSAALFATVYVPFLAGFAVLMLRAPDGADRVTTFVLVTVLSDIGGYVAGVLFGRHQMAPQISPRKSWEGFAGSVLACTCGGALAVTELLDGAWWAGALVGLGVVVTATLGDLGESMIKRDLGVKDMGRLLPGHGGVMDRLDSLLPTAPIAYLLLALLVQVA